MVDRDGLEETGIYRVCCVTSDLQKLRHQYDRQQHRADEMLAEKNVHVAANLLKLFFRELPEPLFTSALYRQFVHAIQLTDMDNQRVTLLKTFELLHPDNRRILLFLLDHLLRVSKYSTVNMMHLENLAVVFGPTLMRPSTLIVAASFSGSTQALNTSHLDLSVDNDQMSSELQGSMYQCQVVLAYLKLRRDGILKWSRDEPGLWTVNEWRQKRLLVFLLLFGICVFVFGSGSGSSCFKFLISMNCVWTMYMHTDRCLNAPLLNGNLLLLPCRLSWQLSSFMLTHTLTRYRCVGEKERCAISPIDRWFMRQRIEGTRMIFDDSGVIVLATVREKHIERRRKKEKKNTVREPSSMFFDSVSKGIYLLSSQREKLAEDRTNETSRRDVFLSVRLTEAQRRKEGKKKYAIPFQPTSKSQRYIYKERACVW